MDATIPPPPMNPLRVGWRAMLFGEETLEQVRQAPNPLAAGLRLAILFALLAGFFRALGTGFDVLVAPSQDDVKTVVLESFKRMSWYRAASSGPAAEEFEAEFERTFELWWRLLPSLFGVPSPGAAVAQLVLWPVAWLAGWLVLSPLVFVFARLLGGRASLGETLGALGLATAPNLLHAVSIWPGAEVGGLVAWWTLALSYWAILKTHQLSWSRGLLALLLPRVLIYSIVFVAGGLLFMLAAAMPGNGG